MSLRALELKLSMSRTLGDAPPSVEANEPQSSGVEALNV